MWWTAEVEQLWGAQRAEFRSDLFARQDGRCHYCRVKMTLHQDQPGGFQPRTLASLDHRVPQSAGGTLDPSNLVLACRVCNHRKGSGPAPAAGEWDWTLNPRWYQEGGPLPRRAEDVDGWTEDEDRALFLLSHPRVIAARQVRDGQAAAAVLPGRSKVARRNRRKRMKLSGEWSWQRSQCIPGVVEAFIHRLHSIG